MRELHLFAGAGGGILGGILLGHVPVCAVEINPYCRKVLAARQADGCLPAFPILEDVRAFDGTVWRGKVDVVCGGFPCQPWSTAGKRLGTEDPRHLWPEMARIISEVRPAYVFAENVSLAAFEQPWRDLRGMGYRVPPALCLGASHLGAPHRRLRWWMLAADADRQPLRDAPSKDVEPREPVGEVLGRDGGAGHVADAAGARLTEGLRKSRREIRNEGRGEESERRGAEVADTSSVGLEGGENGDAIHRSSSCERDGESVRGSGRVRPGWWATEPRVGRVAHGVASRVDRLKALGNGQVPQVAAAAFLELMGFAELRDDGAIQATVDTRPTPSGRSAQCYEVTR